MKRSILLLSAILLLLPCVASAQNNVQEPSTGKWFPDMVTWKHGGRDYYARLTGLAVRKKLIIKVYAIAHYLMDAGKVNKWQDGIGQVMFNGKAKRIVMDFARDVDVPKIRDAYLDGFKENLSDAEFRSLQGQINQFLGYFNKDVRENDRYILTWLPGGVIVATVQGVEKPAIQNEAMAKALWNIWFGDDSIVDREDLVKLMLTK